MPGFFCVYAGNTNPDERLQKMFKASTPESRLKARQRTELIGALESWMLAELQLIWARIVLGFVRINPATKVAVTVVTALIAVGWVESLPL